MVRPVLAAALALATLAVSTPAPSTSPSLYAGYPALDYRSASAPAFARDHRREIVDALHHALDVGSRRIRG
jgi:hypothetical protein